MNTTIQILWRENAVSGSAELTNGGAFSASDTQNAVTEFSVENGRLSLSVKDAELDPGACATVVTVRTVHPFSFFLRDVRAEAPIYIPEYAVIVTTDTDPRNYEQIVTDIRTSGRQTKIQQYESAPEESFEAAASHTRDMPSPTLLGLSRDIRMFEVKSRTLSEPSRMMDVIQPRNHYFPICIDETDGERLEYNYFMGRGLGCRQDLVKRLENGVLPILNIEYLDGDISYHQKMFVVPEKSALGKGGVHGTHYLVSDLYGDVHSELTPEQQKIADTLHDPELLQTEKPVLYLRVQAINRCDAPRYAHLRIPQPNVPNIPERTKTKTRFVDGLCGFETSDRFFMVASLNGKPVRDIEYAILLAPGETAEFLFMIPHTPVSEAQARALQNSSFDEKLEQCITYWQNKLDHIAEFHLPEKRIEEMMRAGFLHLDLLSFGNDPDGPVAPCVGVYTPIGTESTPIIQYMESVGDTKLAERAIAYFLEKQHDDGFMQNFESYMSETGLGLWNAAEHYRYTNDNVWLASVAEHLVRGCRFIQDWTKKSLDPSMKKRGYGMIFGKVADCNLPFRSFFLNTTSWAGIKSCAEVLAEIKDPNAAELLAFAEEYRRNILESIDEAFAVSPAVPLSDGTWCPSFPSWPGINGPRYLFANGGRCYTHGTMVDILDNGCYDILYNMIDANSTYGSFITNSVVELTTLENTAFSQPYYCPHPFSHLMRGETGSFLKEFYNNVSSLADRQTYTFWEHYYQVSPHKTHEEGWFLMRCRWMLFMDTYQNSLRFLCGIPRRWMDDGEQISFSGMKSRYGTISICASSDLTNGQIHAKIHIDPLPGARPDQITIRLPHPKKLTAHSVSYGTYDHSTETVSFPGSDTEIETTLFF